MFTKYSRSGANDKNRGKIRKVTKIFKYKRYNIGFYQETRTDDSDLKIWQQLFGTKNIYFTKHGHRERGTAIVIDDDDNFRVEAELEDPDRQYVVVIGDHNCTMMPIVCYYQFMHHLKKMS